MTVGSSPIRSWLDNYLHVCFWHIADSSGGLARRPLLGVKRTLAVAAQPYAFMSTRPNYPGKVRAGDNYRKSLRNYCALQREALAKLQQ
jgi:hypothetical protein